MSGVVWFAVAVFGSCVAAWHSFNDPERLVGIIDIAATMISILISVSLALMAFLATPFNISDAVASDREERKRINNLLVRDDADFFDGQIVLFTSFFVSLGLLMALKWVTVDLGSPYSLSVQKYLSAITAFCSVFSLLWAARLPTMIRDLAKQRRELG